MSSPRAIPASTSSARIVGGTVHVGLKITCFMSARNEGRLPRLLADLRARVPHLLAVANEVGLERGQVDQDEVGLETAAGPSASARGSPSPGRCGCSTDTFMAAMVSGVEPRVGDQAMAILEQLHRRREVARRRRWSRPASPCRPPARRSRPSRARTSGDARIARAGHDDAARGNRRPAALLRDGREPVQLALEADIDEVIELLLLESRGRRDRLRHALERLGERRRALARIHVPVLVERGRAGRGRSARDR